MTKIVVNYAALENAHSQLQTIARTLDEKLDTLRSGLQRIEWDGQDQAAYQSYQQSWDAAVRDLNQILNEIGNAVGVAKENYLNTEMSNAKAWGQ
jgi:early secretory antigenic target protein ESAT-6